MDDIPMDEGITHPEEYLIDNGDFCESIISRFRDSTREDHQRLCAVIGSMSQELKDQNIPLTSVAYFGATCSSLVKLFSEVEPPIHLVEALLTILSLLLPRISVAILKKKRESVLELVRPALKLPSLSVGAATSGLKCITQFLIIGDGSNWSELSPLFLTLLEFVTDSRPKVRRQSNMCLRHVLTIFQAKSLVAPASEAITKLFERFLLLAGGSSANSGEGPKGAQEVLYILDALKECLPCMSKKSIIVILKYYKTLLELHQPLVTKRIADSLFLLCLIPVPLGYSEALLDLLCSLALSLSSSETSVDGMMFTARLLDVGIIKIYDGNRQMCIVKLPLVFNALKDVLASEHEEVMHATVNTFKSLISHCLDENLIKEGVDQITANINVDDRKSGPTIIEKICATTESLLSFHYTAVWDLVFQVVAIMFDKLGFFSSILMREALKSMADMQKRSGEDFPFRKELHKCLGSALRAMGPETFLGVLPLNIDAKDQEEVNVWLFPILKQYTIGAHLSFFVGVILNMVEPLRQKSEKLKLQGQFVSSRNLDALEYSLWCLMPSFCNYPLDTAQSFKNLEVVLCSVLREEHEPGKPSICGIICSSLHILIKQNKEILENKNSPCEPSEPEYSTARERILALYTPQFATDNLSVLKKSARGFLRVLSGVFLRSGSGKDDGGWLQCTIGEFASIADKEVVKESFQRPLRILLKATRENNVEYSRAQLFDLAASHLPGLDGEEMVVLFDYIKDDLKDGNGLTQKKAYKVLSMILKTSDAFLSSKLEGLLSLMIELLPSCHFASKRHRLDCLYFLIVHISKDNEQRWRDIICSFLTEIVLALKESNKKTRNRAYDILVLIGRACGDEENGGKRENLYQFFQMVAGGLAGETPRMISAAVKGLARLVYEFSDLVSTAYNVLPSTFLLLQRKDKEVIKANLGLLKVLVAKSRAECLQSHLKSMVEGLLQWQEDTKMHFKAKVKLLLEMLVKKCGLDAVKAVMPEEHMKLLTNIRKIKERREKKLAGSSETGSHLSKATTSRLSRWNHTKIFSDFGDEDSENSDAEGVDTNTISRKGGKASSQFKSKASSLRSRSRDDKKFPEHLFDQLEDEPLDLLDRQKTRSALQSSNMKRKKGLEEEPEIDSDGRLIIREDGELMTKKSVHPESDARSEAGSYISRNSKKSQKRQKTSESESGWAYTGNEYASKKAGGDVKKKGKLEPYAYWPLDRKLMSRRPQHRAAAKKGMASVVKLTKQLEGKSASGILSAGSFKFKKGHKKSSNKKSK